MSSELLAKQYCNKNNISIFEFESAGISASPKIGPTEDIKNKLKSISIDYSKHIPKKVNQKLLDNNDLIIAMGKNHQDFLKKEFNQESILFNELIYGEKTSVGDVEEIIWDYENKPEIVKQFVNDTIEHIKNSIPKLIKTLIKNQ